MVRDVSAIFVATTICIGQRTAVAARFHKKPHGL
jgi:hypothetical protein